MPTYYGVQLLRAQRLAFQTVCSGAAASPLAKTVRSRGARIHQRKLAQEISNFGIIAVSEPCL